MTEVIERRGALAPLPEIDDVTRREFLIGAAGLLLLPAGCGGGSSETGAASGETIRVEHAGGVTEVPRGVERIAALDGYPDLHSLLALGVVPEIAAIDDQKSSPVVGDRIDEVEVSVERTSEPNLEALTALEPELIFDVEAVLDVYDELSAIAPTIILHRHESDVDGHLRTVARAVDRTEEAERVISEFEDRTEEVRSVVEGSRLARMPFAVVMQYAYEGTFRVLGKHSYCGRTLQAVGAQGHIDPDVGEPDGDAELSGGVTVSTELLAEVLEPAEFIVVATFPAYEGARPLAENPLWKRLPAVRNGAVVERHVDIWYQDTTLTRTARLDDIEDLVGRFG